MGAGLITAFLLFGVVLGFGLGFWFRGFIDRMQIKSTPASPHAETSNGT